MSKDNVVYVGSKPILNYCMAVIESLRHSDSVVLKARGTAISRAVDVAEVTRNRYLNGVRVESIEIMTEELDSRDGGTRNVSAITILLRNEV
jgi:DNA-binding protein